ncbi:hypothetical protein F2P79_019302 [Pimephales promelas]|nr:hypothetical protein F2P79_019302 [Pimephales promelas]
MSRAVTFINRRQYKFGLRQEQSKLKVLLEGSLALSKLFASLDSERSRKSNKASLGQCLRKPVVFATFSHLCELCYPAMCILYTYRMSSILNTQPSLSRREAARIVRNFRYRPCGLDLKFFTLKLSLRPFVGLRKKERLSQRPPEPVATAKRSPESLPRVSPLPSPPPLTDAQLPASAHTAVASGDEAEGNVTGDCCSILAFDSEEWSGSITPPPPQSRNRGCFPHRHRQTPTSSGRRRREVIHLYSPLEEAVVVHLCPPSTRWRSMSTLPSKVCRTTGAFVILQILQADLFREWDEKGPDPAAVMDLRSITWSAKVANVTSCLGDDRAAAQATQRNLKKRMMSGYPAHTVGVLSVEKVPTSQCSP